MTHEHCFCLNLPLGEGGGWVDTYRITSGTITRISRSDVLTCCRCGEPMVKEEED